MLCEALAFGLLIDPQKAERILGRDPPPPPVAPDPKANLHNSLTFWWWLLEFLPHSYYDAATKRVKWRIPLGTPRVVNPGSVVHATVNEKLLIDPTYRPTNLSANLTTEPRHACKFA
jgi:hypothetical protein